MKKIILAVAVAAVAIMAVAASVASAGGPPARYQMHGLTITAVQPKDVPGQFNDVWTHTFNVTFDSSCAATGGSFTGTGSVSGTDSGLLSTETITGNLNADGTISFTAVRDTDGLVTTLNNVLTNNTTVPGLASASWLPASVSLDFRVTTLTTTSGYANHGDYVSSVGGGSDAAHSCIGMPIK